MFSQGKVLFKDGTVLVATKSTYTPVQTMINWHICAPQSWFALCTIDSGNISNISKFPQKMINIPHLKGRKVQLRHLAW
jgi:hypothetical protein